MGRITDMIPLREHGCEHCEWLESRDLRTEVPWVFKRTVDGYLLIATTHGQLTDENQAKMNSFFKSAVDKGKGEFTESPPDAPHYFWRWIRRRDHDQSE